MIGAIRRFFSKFAAPKPAPQQPARPAQRHILKIAATKEGWEWADIKCELEKRGVNLVMLADRLGVSPQAVTKVKYWTSAPIQQAIADALGIKPEEIWPDRYQSRREA